jgi:hypothetical protein
MLSIEQVLISKRETLVLRSEKGESDKSRVVDATGRTKVSLISGKLKSSLGYITRLLCVPRIGAEIASGLKYRPAIPADAI